MPAKAGIQYPPTYDHGHGKMLLGLHSRQCNRRHALRRSNQRLGSANLRAPDGSRRRLHKKVSHPSAGLLRTIQRDRGCEFLREKRLKKWNRVWKVRLIEELNPNWDDLYPQIAQP